MRHLFCQFSWPVTALFGLSIWLLTACAGGPTAPAAFTASAPNGGLTLSFFLTANGSPAYTLQRGTTTVLDTSLLGFELKGYGRVGQGMAVETADVLNVNEPWTTVWGERKEVANSYQQLTATLTQAQPQPITLQVVFRVFDDGLGFRYIFPEQPNLTEAVITDELTQFALTGDHTAWWIPADYDSYEYLYTESKVTAIDASALMEKNVV